MSPLIPTDPSLVVPSLERSNTTVPVVLLGYVLVTLLLLARGVRRNWMGDPGTETPGNRCDGADADGEIESEEPFVESREEAFP